MSNDPRRPPIRRRPVISQPTTPAPPPPPTKPNRLPLIIGGCAIGAAVLILVLVAYFFGPGGWNIPADALAYEQEMIDDCVRLGRITRISRNLPAGASVYVSPEFLYRPRQEWEAAAETLAYLYSRPNGPDIVFYHSETGKQVGRYTPGHGLKVP